MSLINTHLLVSLVKSKWKYWGKLYNSVLIFGAGKHTRWLLSVLEDEKGPIIAAITDENITSLNYPVKTVPECSSIHYDAVLISTDTFNDQMTIKAKELFGENSKILDFYTDLPKGPYKKETFSLNLLVNRKFQGKELKALIIGAGKAAYDLHAPVYKDHPIVHLEGVVDPNVERAKKLAQRYDLPKTYKELKSAIDDKYDIVSICSPPDLHYSQAKQTLEANCLTIVEKPLCAGAHEIESFKKLFIKYDNQITLIHNQKFVWSMQAMKALVIEGSIGTPIQIDRAWIRNGFKDRMIPDKNFWCHELEGGRWAETVPHDIYSMLQFYKNFSLVNVHVEKKLQNWPWLQGDIVLITLQSNDGNMHNIRFQATNHGNISRHMTIRGSQGILISDGEKLILQKENSSPEIIKREGLYEDKSNFFQGPGHKASISCFINSVLKNSKKPTSWDEIESTMKLTFQIGKEIKNKYIELL